MKLFTTKSIETVKCCQEYFYFALPSVLWAKRVSKLESSFEWFFTKCSGRNLQENLVRTPPAHQVHPSGRASVNF